MSVKIRIHCVIEEKFIIVIEHPLPGLEKGERPVREGYIGYYSPNITIETSNTNPGHLPLYLTTCLYQYYLNRDPRI